MVICAADGQMLRKTDGSLCSRASAVRCNQCFPDTAPEQFFLREMSMKEHLEHVDVFTTPSRFMIRHFTDWGIDASRIVQVTNGQQELQSRRGAGERSRAAQPPGLFRPGGGQQGRVGRPAGGRASAPEGFTEFVVEINGDNLRYASEKRRREFEAFMEREGERPVAEQNVVFNGSYHTEQLAARMSRVDWCIVPSVWWESFGLVISEAWMFHRPIIASNVGGMAERITHDVDGLLFQVADPRSLARTMRRACTEEGLWERLVSGIEPPAGRDVMVERFCGVYRERELVGVG